MAHTVDDSSAADDSTPSADPSDHEDEVESLPDTTRRLSHWPVSMQGAPGTLFKIFSFSEDASGARQEMNINVSGEAKFEFHQPTAGGHAHPASDAAFNGFSFKSSSIELGSSGQRNKFIKRRFPLPALEHDCYAPYVQISNPVARRKLIQIAQEFNFLDQVFAECFRAFEEPCNHNTIGEQLLRIRNDLAKSQRQRSGPSDPEEGYIGSLGKFCEDVCASWKKAASNRQTEGYKNDLRCGKDYLMYLQDTLEIPYWHLVIDLLLDWRESNKSNILGTAILYMLRYKVLLCGNKVDELAQMAVPDTKDRDGLITLIGSIRKRLACLNDSLDIAIPDEGLELTASVATDVQGVESELEPEISTGPVSTKHYVSMQLALFVLFIILAFIPGYQGFAISTQSHENGATNDSDFYYLIQSSIMSVLGNFATALPLLQSGRISGPSRFFWAFGAMGLFSAILSVVIYPLANTGWSSVVSFVGTVASAASVLVLTVATAREQTTGRGSCKHLESITKARGDRNDKLKMQ